MRHPRHEPAEGSRSEPFADRLERFADAFELFVVRQIDIGDALAASELHQSRVDDVDGAKNPACEHQPHEQRGARHEHRRKKHRPDGVREIVSDQHRRKADANRAERGFAELKRQRDVETAIRVDRAHLSDGAAVEHPGEIFSWLEPLSLQGGKAVGNRDALVVDHRCVSDVPSKRGRRCKN